MTFALCKLYVTFKSKYIRSIIKNFILKRENGAMYSPTIRKIYKEVHGIEIGYGTYGGCFSLSNIPPNVTFGNYCSIAQNIKIFRANHPKDTFTTHPLLYNPIAGYVKKDMLNRAHLLIGNDVWIGEGAIILPNVKYIGNGAIVGAGSIVTKDVDDYSIVAGNPAKIIGKRFQKDIIADLESSKWWTLDKDELIRNIPNLSKIARTINE